MIISLLVSVSTVSAAEIQDFLPEINSAWSTATQSFDTTLSPCLDGLVLNFRAAGCKMIATNEGALGSGSVGLICVSPTVENGWSLNEHVIFHTPNFEIAEFKGWNMFCVDANISMYVSSAPKFGKTKAK